VAATAPADSIGNPTGGEEVARVLPGAGGSTEEGPTTGPMDWAKLPGTGRYLHPLAQAPCWLRAAPRGDEPAAPAAAAEALAVAPLAASKCGRPSP